MVRFSYMNCVIFYTFAAPDLEKMDLKSVENVIRLARSLSCESRNWMRILENHYTYDPDVCSLAFSADGEPCESGRMGHSLTNSPISVIETHDIRQRGRLNRW